MASVAEIDGLTISSGPAFVGLLDTYTDAAAGYSTRRLASSATNLMRIREDSGDTETDIGYDSNNELATAAIATHCGSANGFVVKWYDQSGNGNDAEQPTAGGAALQPKIYDGTTQSVITENGKPAVEFDGTNHYLLSSTWDGSNIDNLSHSRVYSTPSAAAANVGGTIWSFGHSTNTSEYVLSNASTGLLSGEYVAWSWANFQTSPSFNERLGSTTYRRAANTQVLEFENWLASGFNFYQDGASQTIDLNTSGWSTSSVCSPSITPTNRFGIGVLARPAEDVLQAMKAQELIYWDINQSGNRTDIEGNQNAHFQIGNFGTPTSGLLFDYPDAAAAYSVRQLANTAALSMRVRRDTGGGTGDDDEADVLFDFTLTDPTISLDSRINNASAGVASTTLGEFLNATGYTDVDSLGTVADGFCDTWYDQSGNGNDAEQTVPGNQPQIFDSASPTDLIQENGKPAVDLDGNDNLRVLFASAFSQPNSYFVTATLETTASAQVLLSGHTLTTERNQIELTGANKWNMYAFSSLTSTISGDTDQHLHNCLFNSSFSNYYLDGTSIASASVGTYPMDGITIGARFTQTLGWNGTIQEVIMWPTNQDSAGNRSGIETNIDNYYNIPGM